MWKRKKNMQYNTKKYTNSNKEIHENEAAYRPRHTYGRIFNRLWDIQRQRITWPWKLG